MNVRLSFLNKNRVKTFLQRMREAEELFRIEKARAKHRQGVEPGTEFAASEYGRSRQSGQRSGDWFR